VPSLNNRGHRFANRNRYRRVLFEGAHVNMSTALLTFSLGRVFHVGLCQPVGLNE